MEDCCRDAGDLSREKSDTALMISSEPSTAPLAPTTARAGRRATATPAAQAAPLTRATMPCLTSLTLALTDVRK